MKRPLPSSPLPLIFGFLNFGAGGAQELILTACRHLDRNQFAPHLLCLGGGGRWTDRARAEGLPISELNRLTKSWDFPAVDRTRRQLAAFETQILHVPLYSRASPYFRLAARLARVPLVVAHEVGHPEPLRWRRRFADTVLAGETRFLATSEFHRRELLDQGTPRSRIEVVYSGIDIAPCEKSQGSRVRQELGIGACPLVLVPARLHPMKGHLDLIAALPALLAEVPDAVLLFAGEGPSRVAIERVLTERGLDRQVFLLGQRDDVPALLAAADVVCLPSRREGLPAALLEAFAAGKAVVATRVGGVPEALSDGAEGLLVPPRDPKALARALAHLLRHDENRRTMGAAGQRTVQQRFRAADTTRALEACYRQWLAERRGLEGW